MKITANFDANIASVDAAFAGARFPLVVTVNNLMPMNVVFPEIGGMVLRPVGGTQSGGRFTVPSMDALKRFVSSVAQVAANHGIEEAVELDKDEALMVKSTREAANKTRPAPKAEGGE